MAMRWSRNVGRRVAAPRAPSRRPDHDERVVGHGGFRADRRDERDERREPIALLPAQVSDAGKDGLSPRASRERRERRDRVGKIGRGRDRRGARRAAFGRCRQSLRTADEATPIRSSAGSAHGVRVGRRPAQARQSVTAPPAAQTAAAKRHGRGIVAGRLEPRRRGRARRTATTAPADAEWPKSRRTSSVVAT